MDVTGGIFIQSKLKGHIETFLRQSEKPAIGFLISIPHTADKQAHVTSAVCCTSTDPKVVTGELQNALLTMPGGCHLFGVFFKCNGDDSIEAVRKTNGELVPSGVNSVFGDHKYVLAINTENEQSCMYMNNYENETFEIVDYETLEDLHSFIPFRLQGNLPLNFEYSKLAEDLKFQAQSEFMFLENTLKSGITCYHVKNSEILLTHNKERPGTSSKATCEELLEELENTDILRKKNRKAFNFSQEVVHVELLCQIAGDAAVQRTVPCAPLIHHEHKYYREISFELPIDVVVYMHHKDASSVLYERLTEAVVRQLFCMENYMLRNIKEIDEIYTPEPFHFQPPQLCHVITVVYPNGVPEEGLANTRKLLHTKLMLPCDRPYLRRLNQRIWPDEKSLGGYLINVHNGVKASGVKDGEKHLISGRYSYHHYMQDGINDDGWGCAYRSLQTLVSWFRLQGYTTKSIPTLRDIQETLVKLGDKPEKFTGSKSWIGSVEVGMVLEQWVDIQSKILFVSSGAEMSTKGRELAIHFDTQGTPVMIGGGVLAHTILGVDFDEVTGKLEFLILDPHYTGGEDIKTIQDKGWCGWKTCDFWDKNAHYNMCMPQRPDLL